MYINWLIENDKEYVVKKTFSKLLNCSEDEVWSELEYQGIKSLDDIDDEKLYNTVVCYDIKV